MPTALITGTTGLVGAPVAQMLAERFDVVVLNRGLSRHASDHRSWDFRGELPANLPENIDLVVHAAATDGREAADPEVECFAVNTQATARLLQYAARSGAKQFVYFSTGSVYPLKLHPSRETDRIAPEGHYAASKAAAEALVTGNPGTMRTLSLRLFHPYGPGQRYQRLIPRLAEGIRTGRSIRLNGQEGRPRINPVFVRDVVEWVRRLIEVDAVGIFNLAGPEPTTIRALAERIARMLGTPATFEVGADLSGDRLGDISRVTRATGYAPRFDLDSGLAATLGLEGSPLTK